MCGIAGYYGKLLPDRRELLSEMGHKLAHRGPDAEGVYLSDQCGLVHRRLSIIDPSASANQPMFSPDQRYVMVFNGEVYNFRELRNQLPGPFLTSSDTEVVLHAFMEWGSSCVSRLNGMFAFAVYDTLTRELSLFRDRLGIKPLYYCISGDEVYFASELKALTDIPALKNQLSVDQASVQTFLHLGYIPDPASIYTGIRKLPPAGRMLITESGISTDTYWNADHFATYDAQLTPDTAEARLRSLLQQSVQRQMISDVPFGVFLSGGVDSSLVAALASEAAGTPVSTFTIGFEETSRDESPYAERVAKIIGSKHQCFILHWSDALAKITEGMDLYDEPFADSSFLPLMMVSEQASRSVKMVLTGDGGDELFYGYGVHAWARRLSDPFKEYLYAAARPFLPVLGQRGKRVKQLLAYQGNGFKMAHLFSQEQYLFSQDEISDLLLKKPTLDYIPPDSRFFANPNATPTDRQALFDLQFYLPGDLLTKVDRASMHYSLESRVPLLDHELVEFALSLPLRMKTDGQVWKWLLKRTLAHYLPEELINRPKQGFSVPLASWLRKDLKFLADTLLSDDAIAETGFFDPGIVKKLKKDFYFGNQTYLYNRIWLLIVMQRWFVRNQIRNVN